MPQYIVVIEIVQENKTRFSSPDHLLHTRWKKSHKKVLK